MPRSRIDKTRVVFRVFIVPDPSAGAFVAVLLAVFLLTRRGCY